MRILVAGLGNIFFGDDAFGVEVANVLAHTPLPRGVEVRDFGIRSYDLAYAMMDGYDLTILVDAVSTGQKPGTLSLIEPETVSDIPEIEMPNAHALNPSYIFQLVESLGGHADHVLLLGCEPESLGGEEGRVGLSDTIQTVIPQAVEMLRMTLTDFASDHVTDAAEGNGSRGLL